MSSSSSLYGAGLTLQPCGLIDGVGTMVTNRRVGASQARRTRSRSLTKADRHPENSLCVAVSGTPFAGADWKRSSGVFHPTASPRLHFLTSTAPSPSRTAKSSSFRFDSCSPLMPCRLTIAAAAVKPMWSKNRSTSFNGMVCSTFRLFAYESTASNSSSSARKSIRSATCCVVRCGRISSALRPSSAMACWNRDRRKTKRDRGPSSGTRRSKAPGSMISRRQALCLSPNSWIVMSRLCRREGGDCEEAAPFCWWGPPRPSPRASGCLDLGGDGGGVFDTNVPDNVRVNLFLS
jgi:hypothetical protein